jgi:hypothetical protein
VKYLSILFALFLSLSSVAQYTEVINSKRPGFSESPFGIGTKVYQIESGLFYLYDAKPFLYNTKKSKGLDIFLRSGFFWEKFELNANFKFQSDAIIKNTSSLQTFSKGGISQFTIGGKYLFYMPTYKDPAKEIRSWKAKTAFDWKRLVPSVGLYLGLNTNFVSSYYKAPSLSPKILILLQNDITENFIVVTNIFGDYLTNKQRNFGYIATLTYSFNEKFSIFGEYKGVFAIKKNTFDFGGGAAYLINKNFQIGINVRRDTDFNYGNIYAGLGLSYRIDRHKDKLIIQRPNEDGTGRVQYKKDSFFKRIFSRKGRRAKAPRKRKGKRIRRKLKPKSAKKEKRKKRKRRSRRARRSRRSRRSRT